MQSNKIKSQMKMHNTIFKIDKTSWSFLADLLEHGYPIMNAITFLKLDEEGIQTQLEEGNTLIEILLRGQKGRFYTHLRFFVSIMSLSNAIKSSLALIDFEKGLQQKLLKKSIYPCCILVFSYVLLWFFSSAIIPQMMESFSMDNSFQTLALFVHIIKLFCIIVTILFLLSVVVVLYFMHDKKTRSLVLYKMHNRLSICKDYESYLFSGYLLEMEKQGISTRQAMLYLSNIQEDSLFTYMIQELHQHLNHGEDFLDVIEKSTWLNESFIMSFRVGASTSKICEMLETFMQQQEYLWEKTIKKISGILQCISYSFVGFVVLIVYQIMLVPLSMLEQM